MSPWSILIGCGVLAVGTYQARDPVQVRVAHAPVYVERDAIGQYVNRGLRITNSTAERVVLRRLEMSVLDRTGVLVRPTVYRPLTELVLKDRLIVYDGHDYYSHHRRLDLSDPRIKRTGLTESPVRYAYDFSTVDETGALHRGGAPSHEEWFAYRTPVHAPGPGRVVSSANDVADNRLDNGRLIPASTADPVKAILGNHVVIDHQNGEFSFLAHLRAGSVTVSPGDVVAQDQLLGQVGFSGDTGTHVHLHYHLASGLDMRTSSGRPAYFRAYQRLLGASTVEVRDGLLHTGDIVRRPDR